MMTLPRDAKHDFWAMASPALMADPDTGMATNSKDLWAEAVVFIAAGGATTATALSGVFFYLSRNPHAYDKLAREIRTTFSSSSSGKDIKQGPRLSGCKYLRAVIEETMRLSPSALSPPWRQQDPASVAAGEYFVVDGHVIPPGTQVAVSNYALQHNEEYFPEPYRFLPERWLEVEDSDFFSDMEGKEKRKMADKRVCTLSPRRPLLRRTAHGLRRDEPDHRQGHVLL